MNIIVTGALGHIGTYLLSNSHLIQKVNKIYAIDKLDDRMLNLINLKLKKKINFINLDLSKKNLKFDNKFKIDILIHLASRTDAASSFKHEKEVYRNNLSCFKNVVNFCQKRNIKLIHISSTSVYGSQKKFVDETCKDLVPQSPYAKVKIIEEMRLKKTKKSFRFITLRFGTIAGPSSGMRFHTAVNKFCMQAFMKQPLNVWETALNQYRPYLSIRDAFKTFDFIITNKLFDRSIYNVVSENLTVKDIIRKLNIKNTKIKLVKTKIMNQLSYKIDNAKIKKTGLKLNNKIKDDIKNTFKVLKLKSLYEDI